jgi:hypothetical protein
MTTTRSELPGSAPVPDIEPVVLYEVRDTTTAVITLNRPAYRNAQNSVMTYALDDAFYRAAADDDVKVIVLNGTASTSRPGTTSARRGGTTTSNTSAALGSGGRMWATPAQSRVSPASRRSTSVCAAVGASCRSR